MVIQWFAVAEIHPFCAQCSQCFFSLVISTYTSNHVYIGTQSVSRECLVGALTAGETPHHGVGDGFTGLWKVIHAGNDVQVNGADDGN